MTAWRDKVVLITGGSAGFGLELARAFAAERARVVIVARDPDRVRSAVESIHAAGGEALGVDADVTRDEDVDRMLAQTLQRFSRLDVLVNNAGRSTRSQITDVTPDQFQSLLELNFLAAVRCTQTCLPALQKSSGHLVFMASLAARAATPLFGAYPASKAPLALYAQQLRLELAEQGLHVLLVCPGPIARSDAGQRYDDQTEGLPEAARQPGGGVRLSGLTPDYLAAKIMRACQRRQAELVLPGKARLLFALAALSPRLGDAILKRMS